MKTCSSLLAALFALCIVVNSRQPVAAAAYSGPDLDGFSKAQIEELRDAVQKDTSKLLPVFKDAVRQAVSAGLAKDSKEADVKAKLEAVARAEADIALVYSAAVKKLVVLTTNQQARIQHDGQSMYGYIFGVQTGFTLFQLFGTGFTNLTRAQKVALDRANITEENALSGTIFSARGELVRTWFTPGAKPGDIRVKLDALSQCETQYALFCWKTVTQAFPLTATQAAIEARQNPTTTYGDLFGMEIRFSWQP